MKTMISTLLCCLKTVGKLTMTTMSTRWRKSWTSDGLNVLVRPREFASTSSNGKDTTNPSGSQCRS
ncbi:hypothetical protein PF007_g31606 [Phytophthora fragariae]|uniref:RxLR effector protein n=2 Tax=Phytophthora TaxID=4783 RepID=A0A6A3G3F2_9STRA|nr:hypothetical protein PR002_g33048 [Phytophthora rubi]KAE8951979.1 hypothetical protein PR002_g32812 [Phytophthora rubi]KAE9057562.1 hypothetical protein PF007_g31606 [Phytophthora fragariae]